MLCVCLCVYAQVWLCSLIIHFFHVCQEWPCAQAAHGQRSILQFTSNVKLGGLMDSYAEIPSVVVLAVSFIKGYFSLLSFPVKRDNVIFSVEN